MADPIILREVEIANSEALKLTQGLSLDVRAASDTQIKAAYAKIQEIDKLRKNIILKRNDINRPHRIAIAETDELFKKPIAQLEVTATFIREALQKHKRKA